MKRNKIYIVIGLLILCLVISYCMNISLYYKGCITSHIAGKNNNSKSIMEVSTVSYNDVVLEEILACNESMSSVNKRYPMECVRHIYDSYRVSYLGQDKVLTHFYDEDGNFILGRIYRQNKFKDDFKKIHFGMKCEDVKAFDNDGCFLSLYVDGINLPKESIHYTKDGYIITIRYDKRFLRVIDIEMELI